MTNINWDVTVRFDPNSVEPSTHGIPVPSYGNYGGPNYTAGVVNGTTPELADLNPLDVTTYPLDPLDWLFWEHDLAYQNATSTSDIAQADVHLVEQLFLLTQTEPTFFAEDPEALLYDAFATLSIVGKVLSTPDELYYLQGLPPSDQNLVGAAALSAIPNFETGLAETPGNESRGLHAALHVFEAHFGDLLIG
jgi:hypothetical protein